MEDEPLASGQIRIRSYWEPERPRGCRRRSCFTVAIAMLALAGTIYGCTSQAQIYLNESWNNRQREAAGAVRSYSQTADANDAQKARDYAMYLATLTPK